MASPSNRKTSSPPDKAARRNKRIAIIAVVLVVIMAPVIWFSMEYFAPVSPLGQLALSSDGKNMILKFSEKSSEQRYQDHQNTWEEKNVHYAYYLELVDSVSKQSLDKIKFKSPVSNIQSNPEMVAATDGSVWLVSVTNADDKDRPGFILKFTIKNGKIVKENFSLDEKYHIRELKDHKVLLSDGKKMFSGYNPVFGAIYLDLDSGKIVDDRKELN